MGGRRERLVGGGKIGNDRLLAQGKSGLNESQNAKGVSPKNFLGKYDHCCKIIHKVIICGTGKQWLKLTCTILEGEFT